MFGGGGFSFGGGGGPGAAPAPSNTDSGGYGGFGGAPSAQPPGGLGGFLGQATQATQAPAGGNRQRDSQSLMPLTIRMLIDAHESSKTSNEAVSGVEAALMVNGREASMVTFVACVESFISGNPFKTWKVSDGSARIDVKMYHDNEQTSSVVTPQPGDYVRVYGHLRHWNGDMHVGGVSVLKCDSSNEIAYHMVEVAYTHLALAGKLVGKTSPPVAGSVPTAAPVPQHQQSMSGPQAGQHAGAGFSGFGGSGFGGALPSNASPAGQYGQPAGGQYGGQPVGNQAPYGGGQTMNAPTNVQLGGQPPVGQFGGQLPGNSGPYGGEGPAAGLQYGGPMAPNNAGGGPYGAGGQSANTSAQFGGGMVQQGGPYGGSGQQGGAGPYGRPF